MASSDSSNNQLAVVTGASTGIGYELAKQFAQNGFDLVIASDEAQIEKVGKEIQDSYGVRCESVQVDLTKFDGVEQLYYSIEKLGQPVDALALNAGIGANGNFADEIPLDEDLKTIELNVTSAVHLSKLVLKDMCARKSGKVLFTSSIVATAPAPYLAVYSGTKAFLYSFAESIRAELKDSGVTVTALMPGPTDTEFFRRSDMEDTGVATGHKDDPADVAKDGLEALMAGKDHVVAGSIRNAAAVKASKIIPDTVIAEQQGKMTKPGSGS